MHRGEFQNVYHVFESLYDEDHDSVVRILTFHSANVQLGDVLGPNGVP